LIKLDLDHKFRVSFCCALYSNVVLLLAVVIGGFSSIFVLLGRLLRVGLIQSSQMYVRPSTKSFFNFNEIWYVGRGR